MCTKSACLYQLRPDGYVMTDYAIGSGYILLIYCETQLFWRSVARVFDCCWVISTVLDSCETKKVFIRH